MSGSRDRRRHPGGVAGAALAGMGADRVHAAHVGPDRRQGPDGPGAAAQPLVAHPAVRHLARPDDLADPLREPGLPGRLRLPRPPAGRHRRRRPARSRCRSSRCRSPRSIASSWRGCETWGSTSGSGRDRSRWPTPSPSRTMSSTPAYDPDHANVLWRGLLRADGLMKSFQTGFVGKASPVHLFWGSFDLAATRFSGRPAPLHPGGAPNCPDWVMEEAYSREESSIGWWPADHDARSRVLRVHLPGADGVRGRGPTTRRGDLRPPITASSSFPTTRFGPAPIRTPPCSSSSSRPTRLAPISGAGIAPRSSRRSFPTGPRPARGARPAAEPARRPPALRHQPAAAAADPVRFAMDHVAS